jgi:hypothetical protein
MLLLLVLQSLQQQQQQHYQVQQLLLLVWLAPAAVLHWMFQLPPANTQQLQHYRVLKGVACNRQHQKGQ